MRKYLYSLLLLLSMVFISSCQTTAICGTDIDVEYIMRYGTPYSFGDYHYYMLNGAYYNVYRSNGLYHYRVIHRRPPTPPRVVRPPRSNTPPPPRNNPPRGRFGGGRR